jgi:hypothetical protein
MITVDIKGRCPQKKKLERFAYDVIHSFFNSRFRRDVCINIQVQRSLENDYLGLCIGDLEDVDIELARYDEHGEPLDAEYMAQNLAHELVHAKQYLKGQIDGTMRYRQSSKTKWIDCTDVAYQDQPWEIEAYDLEEKLLEKYW